MVMEAGIGLRKHTAGMSRQQDGDEASYAGYLSNFLSTLCIGSNSYRYKANDIALNCMDSILLHATFVLEEGSN